MLLAQVHLPPGVTAPRGVPRVRARVVRKETAAFTINSKLCYRIPAGGGLRARLKER